MPLIRYRTGDQVVASREACSCGSPYLKLAGGIRGRVDDMLTVRGVNLYPSQIEEIVRRHAGSSEFVIERRSVEQMDEVMVVVEEAPGLSVERLEADLRQALGVRLGCRVVPAGSLPRTDLKSRRIVQIP